MLDISFTDGFVTIESDACGMTTISEFPSDVSPIEIDEIEVAGHKIMLDGSVLYWSKPSAYSVKVSVIPHTKEDESLSKLADFARVKGGKDQDGNLNESATKALAVKMIVGVPAEGGSLFKQLMFDDGRMVGGSPGVSVDSDGKMQSKTFSFVFADLKRSFN